MLSQYSIINTAEEIGNKRRIIMANRFVLNETSYHGKGAIKEIATEVKARGFAKCFVCSDPDLIKFGVTKKVTDILESNGFLTKFILRLKPIPPLKTCRAVLRPSKTAVRTA